MAKVPKKPRVLKHAGSEVPKMPIVPSKVIRKRRYKFPTNDEHTLKIKKRKRNTNATFIW